jgi:hypothetical protein
VAEENGPSDGLMEKQAPRVGGGSGVSASRVPKRRSATAAAAYRGWRWHLAHGGGRGKVPKESSTLTSGAGKDSLGGRANVSRSREAAGWHALAASTHGRAVFRPTPSSKGGGAGTSDASNTWDNSLGSVDRPCISSRVVGGVEGGARDSDEPDDACKRSASASHTSAGISGRWGWVESTKEGAAETAWNADGPSHTVGASHRPQGKLVRRTRAHLVSVGAEAWNSAAGTKHDVVSTGGAWGISDGARGWHNISGDGSMATMNRSGVSGSALLENVAESPLEATDWPSSVAICVWATALAVDGHSGSLTATRKQKRKGPSAKHLAAREKRSRGFHPKWNMERAAKNRETKAAAAVAKAIGAADAWAALLPVPAVAPEATIAFTKPPPPTLQYSIPFDPVTLVEIGFLWRARGARGQLLLRTRVSLDDARVALPGMRYLSRPDPEVVASFPSAMGRAARPLARRMVLQSEGLALAEVTLARARVDDYRGHRVWTLSFEDVTTAWHAALLQGSRVFMRRADVPLDPVTTRSPGSQRYHPEDLIGLAVCLAVPGAADTLAHATPEGLPSTGVAVAAAGAAGDQGVPREAATIGHVTSVWHDNGSSYDTGEYMKSLGAVDLGGACDCVTVHFVRGLVRVSTGSLMHIDDVPPDELQRVRVSLSFPPCPGARTLDEFCRYADILCSVLHSLLCRSGQTFLPGERQCALQAMKQLFFAGGAFCAHHEEHARTRREARPTPPHEMELHCLQVPGAESIKANGTLDWGAKPRYERCSSFGILPASSSCITSVDMVNQILWVNPPERWLHGYLAIRLVKVRQPRRSEKTKQKMGGKYLKRVDRGFIRKKGKYASKGKNMRKT